MCKVSMCTFWKRLKSQSISVKNVPDYPKRHSSFYILLKTFGNDTFHMNKEQSLPLLFDQDFHDIFSSGIFSDPFLL